jgi:hypothetical protein
VSSALLDEIERLIAAAGDADDVLRGTVSALVAEPGVTWAGIGFVEGDEVKLGPASGTPNEARRTRVGVVFEGSKVGELWADGDVDATTSQVLRAASPLRCSSAGTPEAWPGCREPSLDRGTDPSIEGGTSFEGLRPPKA